MRRAVLPLLGLCALALGACADTVQQRPIAHNILEGLVVAPFPVYWLGGSFRGMAVTEATHDPGGAYSVLYGDCLQGGQGTCVAPLRIVSSPDNGFLPGGGAATQTQTIRGVPATLAQGGRTIVLATSRIVVSIYATGPQLASAAASSIVPINEVAVPGATLPPRLPDSGFGAQPLPSQVPSALRPPS
ncbi:MAG: hypothetical protein H0X28_10860 [Solirubrobacterales bacterium]|nr:hypothetical protein [Solirubrobacterales bacterium]